ncbi:MAG: lyase family protein, partial [Pirellulaceae bacterium]|nr:lyase family protein [Pirellulaceae bacterium]
FGGEHEKFKSLEKKVAQKLGFDETYYLTGQTYTRKIDSQVIDVLSGVAQSAHKLATDLRLLANKEEIDEPFEKNQKGSSAMPYKRNPMRSERICSLARFVMSMQSSTANTVATQWFERTLDDSANRRLTLPQAFLAIDAILILLNNIASGMVVYPKVVQKHLEEKLPFMATENIMMAAVEAGGNRQELHEKIRVHSLEAAKVVKLEGKENDLMERLQGDPAFGKVDLTASTAPLDFVGRSVEQVDEFLLEVVDPIREKYQNLFPKESVITV